MAITTEQAGTILRRAHADAPHGEKSIRLILFGVKYAADLERMQLSDVIKKAGLHPSANVEIRYGIKMAKYVQIKVDSGF